MRVEIVHLFISPGHNFSGHFGQAAGDSPIEDRDAVECVEGRGIRGDRYFDKVPGQIGQVTFFDLAVHEELVARFAFEAVSPAVYRRNIVTRGLDLNSLIGHVFEIQGLKFEGTEESRPCVWMNHAVGPGAREFLKGRGGLRAKVMRGGALGKGWHELKDLGRSDSGPVAPGS